MLPWSTELAGRIDQDVFDSRLLRGNPLGDPHQRPLLVYAPPGYDSEPGRRYPVVYVVQGYSGHVGMWFNRAPFRQPYVELADALFASGTAPPALMVFVNGWTAYQFLDSPGTGRYHSYLCDEIVPWVDARVFGALATHAGDAPFDVGYRAELPRRARLLRNHYGGDYAEFLADFRGRPAGTKAWDIDLIEVYAYAAAAFRRAVAAAGVPAVRVHFELFDAGHSLTEHRYALALGWLCNRLAR